MRLSATLKYIAYLADTPELDALKRVSPSNKRYAEYIESVIGGYANA